MEFQNLFTEYNRMPCIVPALKTSHPGGLFCKSINQFSFSFIAPLGTENDRSRHVLVLMTPSVKAVFEPCGRRRRKIQPSIGSFSGRDYERRFICSSDK